MKFARPMPAPPNNWRAPKCAAQIIVWLGLEGCDAPSNVTASWEPWPVAVCTTIDGRQAVRCFFAIDVACTLSLQAMPFGTCRLFVEYPPTRPVLSDVCTLCVDDCRRGQPLSMRLGALLERWIDSDPYLCLTKLPGRAPLLPGPGARCSLPAVSGCHGERVAVPKGRMCRDERSSLGRRRGARAKVVARARREGRRDRAGRRRRRRRAGGCCSWDHLAGVGKTAGGSL